MHPKYSETVDKLKTWSQQEKAVRCTIVLGSQVREEFSGDAWSDLDVLLVVDTPKVFLQTNAWLSFLGEIACVVVEETPLDWLNMTWSVKRVLFADNRTVDFSIMPSGRLDDVLSINAEIHAQGYQIIYDAYPDGVASKIEASLASVKVPPPTIPTEDDVRQVINELSFQLIYACKKIKRNELWVAVSCINQQVSNRLLQLIEFYAASTASVPQSICYEGRFLENRISNDLAEKLSHCYAKYDVHDATQTVHHLLDLIFWLSKAICEANHYPFDAEQFAMIRALYVDMFGNIVDETLVQSGSTELVDANGGAAGHSCNRESKPFKEHSTDE